MHFVIKKFVVLLLTLLLPVHCLFSMQQKRADEQRENSEKLHAALRSWAYDTYFQDQVSADKQEKICSSLVKAGATLSQGSLYKSILSEGLNKGFITPDLAYSWLSKVMLLRNSKDYKNSDPTVWNQAECLVEQLWNWAFHDPLLSDQTMLSLSQKFNYCLPLWIGQRNRRIKKEYTDEDGYYCTHSNPLSSIIQLLTVDPSCRRFADEDIEFLLHQGYTLNIQDGKVCTDNVLYCITDALECKKIDYKIADRLFTHARQCHARLDCKDDRNRCLGDMAWQSPAVSKLLKMHQKCSIEPRSVGRTHGILKAAQEANNNQVQSLSEQAYAKAFSDLSTLDIDRYTHSLIIERIPVQDLCDLIVVYRSDASVT